MELEELGAGGVVRQYRLYFFNGPGCFTHVHEANILRKPTTAQSALPKHGAKDSEMELWQQERRVQRWDCD